MDFLAELRRRSVFRVAAAYLISGWVVMQVVALIASTMAMPDWTSAFVMMLVIAGFPIALIVAWAFELTPEGPKRTQLRGDKETVKPLRSADAILVAGLFIVIGAIIWQQVFSPTTALVPPNAVGTTETTEPGANSIAVLAFSDLSAEGDQQYFSDGISEEILNVLVRIDGLDVTSRTSAFQYRGDTFSIPQIADALNVRHVLEGSVRRSGETVRITAQLIDASNDVHLWSETYDRPFTAESLFTIQDEIAGAIVSALSQTLGMATPDHIGADAGTHDIDAYETYLEARELLYHRSIENLERAIELFTEVVEVDPGFARAWAGLAMAYLVSPSWNVEGDVDWYAEAESAANRATENDDRLALPYSVRGAVARLSSRWEEAVEQSDAAIERDPNIANAWYFRGQTYLALGYFERAIHDFERCLVIDSANGFCLRFMAIAHAFAGNTETALNLFEEGLARGQISYLLNFADLYAAEGNAGAAIATFAFSYATFGGDWSREPDTRWTIDMSYSLDDYKSDLEAAYLLSFGESLDDTRLDFERILDPDPDAAAPYYAWFVWNRTNSSLRRAETRARAELARRTVVQELGLLDYWRVHGWPDTCRPIGNDGFECD